MKKLDVSYATVSRAVKEAEKSGMKMSNVRPEPEEVSLNYPTLKRSEPCMHIEPTLSLPIQTARF
jgi:hypothetical protein